MVTFSKKALLGGYYYKEAFQPAQGYRIFNTWMGDMTKLLQLKAVLQTAEAEGLQQQAAHVGSLLVDLIERVSERYPGRLHALRGVGTIVAFDCETPAMRDALHAALRDNGVLVGVNGTQSIRFRPALTFGPQHVAEFEGVLWRTMEELKW